MDLWAIQLKILKTTLGNNGVASKLIIFIHLAAEKLGYFCSKVPSDWEVSGLTQRHLRGFLGARRRDANGGNREDAWCEIERQSESAGVCLCVCGCVRRFHGNLAGRVWSLEMQRNAGWGRREGWEKYPSLGVFGVRGDGGDNGIEKGGIASAPPSSPSPPTNSAFYCAFSPAPPGFLLYRSVWWIRAAPSIPGAELFSWLILFSFY